MDKRTEGYQQTRTEQTILFIALQCNQCPTFDTSTKQEKKTLDETKPVMMIRHNHHPRHAEVEV